VLIERHTLTFTVVQFTFIFDLGLAMLNARLSCDRNKLEVTSKLRVGFYVDSRYFVSFFI